MVVGAIYQRVPIRHIKNWKYIHAFYCAPLIVRGAEQYCVDQLLQTLQDEKPGITSYGFELLDKDTPFFEIIDGRTNCAKFTESYERAQLNISECDPATLMKSSHRKDLRRRQRKLAELGELTFEFDEANQNIDKWTEDFAELEENGWKGKNRTAMNCNDNDKSFFTEALGNASKSGKLKVTSSRLDGELIASTCDLISGDRTFAFKITYDENHRRLSPGILIVLKHIESLKNSSQLKWADSCSQENSEMANRVYPGRRTITRVIFSKNGTVGSYIITHLLARLPAIKKHFLNRLGKK
jgi:CelD/BcsL family acetyltransferase involved in cellulose biosynthesis